MLRDLCVKSFLYLLHFWRRPCKCKHCLREENIHSSISPFIIHSIIERRYWIWTITSMLEVQPDNRGGHRCWDDKWGQILVASCKWTPSQWTSLSVWSCRRSHTGRLTTRSRWQQLRWFPQLQSLTRKHFGFLEQIEEHKTVQSSSEQNLILCSFHNWNTFGVSSNHCYCRSLSVSDVCDTMQISVRLLTWWTEIMFHLKRQTSIKMKIRLIVYCCRTGCSALLQSEESIVYF